MAVSTLIHSIRNLTQRTLIATLAATACMAATPALATVDMNIALFTDTPDPVPAGGFVTYDLRIENSGDTPTATNATARIQLPAGTIFQSVAPSVECQKHATLNEVNCDFGIMQGTLSNPTAFRTVQIVVQTTTPGTIQADASTLPVDGNMANNADFVRTTVDTGADVRFNTFSAAPNPIAGGGIVTYTVIPENLGPNAAGALTIVFNVPPGLQFNGFSNANGWSSCTAVAVSGGTDVTCQNAGGIGAGSSTVPAIGPTLTWTAKATSASTGTFRTTGSVSSVTGDGNLSNNQATADVVIQPGTDLQMQKSVSANPVVAGTSVTFTLNVTNLGPIAATNARVTDTLPVNFSAIAASGSGWTCTVDQFTRLVSCQRPTFAVGSAPITITATAPANADVAIGGQAASNTASVISDTTDPIAGNDSNTVNFTLQRNGADLRPIMTRAPSPVPLNSDITTTIRIRNDGPLVATGPIRATYQLAAGEQLMSASGTGWTCSPLNVAGALVTCDRTNTTLAVNASTNPLTLITQTSTPGAVVTSLCTSTTAGVAPVETDIDPSNDCLNNDSSVTASATSADLSVAKAVAVSPAVAAASPPTLAAGAAGTVTFTIVVTNAGPDAATNVTLTDPLLMYAAASGTRPATTVAASVTAGATGGETCSGTSTVTCNLGTIAATPGSNTKTVTITLDRPVMDGTWTNTASAFSSNVGDPNRVNNSGSASVAIEAVTDVEVTSKVVAPNPVKSGVEATYTIQLRNNGPSSAANVVLTDTFAAMGANGTYSLISVTGSNGATCPTAPQSGVSAALPVVCNFGTVPANGVRSMTVKIRPDFMAAPPSPRQITNTAAVSTTTFESNSTNNERSATLDISSDEIDLLITETDLTDPVGYSPLSPNSNIVVYKVDVTNRGPSYATGVNFVDVTTPPSGKTLTFLCDRATAPAAPFDAVTSCAATTSTCTGGSPSISCPIGDMAASTSQSRYLVYRVNDAPAITGDTYNKLATVSANEAETLTANNSDPEQTTVRMLADLELVSKTATPATVSLNEPFTWTIVARNNGPGNGINVRVTDTLPAGMVLTGTPTFLVSGVGGASGNCTGTTGATSLACVAGDVDPNATVTVTVPVRVTAFPSGGTTTNTAVVATDSIDPGPGVNTKGGTVTVTKSSLSCTVFHDTNDDGVKQGGEAGIGAVTMTLTGTDAYGNAIGPRTAVTNGAGVCLFDNLPPSGAGGYRLSEAQPAGFVDGRDNGTGTAGGVIVNSKTTDAIDAIAVAANTQIPATQLTFGELQLASIGGRVWHDVNNNGLIDGAETTFIDGVTITLTGTDDLGANVNLQRVTSGGGFYSFTNLRPGTYTLTETQPGSPWLEGQAHAGTGISGGSTGTVDGTLSSPTFGNVISAIDIQSGNTGVDYNFGELRPASLAGLVWYDANNNAIRDGIEPIIGGVTVTLTGTDYRGVAIAPQVATTDNTTGAYSFANLKPGTYTVTETQPTDYNNGQTVAGTVNGGNVGTAGVNTVNSIVLGSAGVGINYNFGEIGRGISGVVYNDLNDNGLQNLPGEVGIPNVSIRLTGCGIDRTTLTNGMGEYSFSGLPDCPAGYTLEETQPAGFADGRDSIGTSGGVVANDRLSNIVLGATTFATGYNFGEHGIVATDIGCTATPPAIVPAGVKNVRQPFSWVYTVAHVSGGAAPGVTMASTLPSGVELTGQPTLSNGGTCTGAAAATSYNCDVGFVQPGVPVTVTVPVRVLSYPATTTVAATATLTTQGSESAPANNVCTANASLQQSTIAGTVYEDPNNNGVIETGEKGIGNVALRLTGRDVYGNDVDVTTTTDATPGATLGTYKFAGLAPADATGYTIVETQPAGYADGRDTAGTSGGSATVNDTISGIVLAANTNATSYDFGEIGQGLAGSVYVDSNNNGVRDPGEEGIPGATIRVTGTSSTGGQVDVTAITDTNGNYLFGGLPASSPAGYTIVETQPVGWSDGLDRVGSVGGQLGNDRITNVVLPAGTIGANYDFGERGGQLCGYVYSDRNDNGIKERAEAGIPGVTIRLTGTDSIGRPVTRVAVTADLSAPGADLGRYCLTDLPVPDAAGYTITETQPADTTDGRDTVGTINGVTVGAAGNDIFTVVNPTTPGFSGQNYNFGERITNAAAVSGYVWFDSNHDRVRDPTGRGGWTVELLSGTPGGAVTVIATVVTDANGFYRFDSLPPGTGYSIQFRSPQGNYVYGYIPNVTLTANTELTEQNQPIDPSGVVYDVLTRQAVPGAGVRLVGPAGFDAATHLVGGPPNLTQTTDTTGEYKFLLLPGAPSGTYRLEVTVPTGYIQRISTAIPACAATLTVGPTPAPALVQTSDRAPLLAIATHNPATCPSTSAGLSAGATTTQYYLAMVLGGTSANLINNHIPVERVPTTDAIIVTKTTPKQEVSRGELVPYTITIRNALDMRLTDIAINDQIPPGFQYRVGSAVIDNVRREPTITGRQHSWGAVTLERNQTVTLKVILVVGSGVGTGEFVNQAWTSNQFTGGVTSNVARAVVRVVPDATFDCSEVIGKVFDDKNRNGVQDEGEPGLANVRVVTVRGQQITTDSFGRYHIACADIPDEDRGSNFVLKLDQRTLPTGYRLTTENPGMARLTRGKMSKINFGASIHRVVRLDLMDQAFEPRTTTLRPAYAGNLEQLLPLLQQEQSVLRIAYARRPEEDQRLAQSRLRTIADVVRTSWRDTRGGYPLAIETEVYQSGGGK